MSDLDQRQFERMQNSLDGFLAGRVQIGSLISDLEGLLCSLEEVDGIWKQSFLSLWGRIEDERAVALSLGIDPLDEDAAKRVVEAVNELKQIILAKMAGPGCKGHA